MKTAVVLISLFYLFTSNIFAAQTADSVVTDVQLRTYLARDNVPLNREVVYHVELSWQGDLQRYHILETGEPVLTNLKLRGSGSANNFYLDEQGRPHSKKTITYYFVPKSMGMAYIDGVIIKYEDKSTAQKESLMSQRLGVKIIDPLPEPGKGFDPAELVLIFIIILFLLIVFYFIYRYYMVRKRRQEILAQKPPSLEETWLQRIRTEINKSDENTSQKFNVLSRLLQNYFKEKFDLQSAATFQEVENMLKPYNLQADINEKLKSFYAQSELSKFAGEKVSEHDFQLFYDTVELLLGKMDTENIEGKQMLEEK